MSDPNYQFDVAISFAGSERVLAQRLADIVKEAGFKVFYDRYEAGEWWGRDLAEYFDHIYRKAARFCVIFVSREYEKRMWTNHERRSALSRRIAEQGNDYILPIEVERVELPGLQPTIGALSVQDFSIEEIAALLIEKLSVEGSRPLSPSSRLNLEGLGVGNHYPRLQREDLCDGMTADTSLIARTALDIPLRGDRAARSILSGPIKRSLAQSLSSSSLEEWLRGELVYCGAGSVEPWSQFGRYNNSVSSTLRWQARSALDQCVLRARCQVWIRPMGAPVITIILDVIRDIGNPPVAWGPTCGAMPLERFLVLLEVSLATVVEGIASTSLGDLVGDAWQPNGPIWFVDAGTLPVDSCIDLSRFRQALQGDRQTEYGMPADAGYNLWSKDGRRQLIHHWVERLLLDLQYEDFESALDQALP